MTRGHEDERRRAICSDGCVCSDGYGGDGCDELRSLAPGETAWPLEWHAQLVAGTYELTWGAEGYGSTTEEFSIVEKDGRLYFQGAVLATIEPEESSEQ